MSDGSYLKYYITQCYHNLKRIIKISICDCKLITKILHKIYIKTEYYKTLLLPIDAKQQQKDGQSHEKFYCGEDFICVRPSIQLFADNSLAIKPADRQPIALPDGFIKSCNAALENKCIGWGGKYK